MNSETISMSERRYVLHNRMVTREEFNAAALHLYSAKIPDNANNETIFSYLK